MKKIDCKNWKDCGNSTGGCCELNKFGGKPSFGTCLLACEDYQGDQKIKDFIDMSPPDPPSPPDLPSLRKRATNYLGFLFRKTAAKMKGLETQVTQEVFDKRIAICRTDICRKRRVVLQDDGDGNEYEIESCAECGCPYMKKLWEATEECPLSFWDAEVDREKKKPSFMSVNLKDD